MFAFAGFTMVSCGETKAKEEKTDLKDHVCTEACHEAGQCVTVCGEKGHTCTADCKKEM